MTSTDASKSVLIIAAEASSALYAQRLMEHWKRNDVDLQCFGVGDQNMVDLGFEALGRAEEMAVVGIQEVLKHWSEIKYVFNRTLEEVDQRRPAFALLLDYPGFNLRLAKKLKERGVRVVYYISPQIWAWKKGRIKQMKKYVDLVLTIFPFENQFYETHGVPVEFVGHPLLDEIAEMNGRQESRDELRRRYGIDSGHFVLGLMPGSRKSEIGHHLETQLAVARALRKKDANIKTALLIAPGLNLDEIRPQLEGLRFPVIIVQAEPFQMIRLTDVVLCASGTATLMVALMKKPMVVMYKMNGVTAFLAKLLVGKKNYFAMVNLILGKEVVPERFQEKANVKELRQLIEKFKTDSQYYKRTADQLDELKLALGEEGATGRVASALEPFFSGASE